MDTTIRGVWTRPPGSGTIGVKRSRRSGVVAGVEEEP
jgi:hypothetical protein